MDATSESEWQTDGSKRVEVEQSSERKDREGGERRRVGKFGEDGRSEARTVGLLCNSPRTKERGSVCMVIGLETLQASCRGWLAALLAAKRADWPRPSVPRQTAAARVLYLGAPLLSMPPTSR